MQQVVLPSLWPRKRNTRGPAAGDEGDDGAGAITMNLEEKANREVEEEKIEGMRWRGREGRGYEIPGAMPGMMVT